METASGFGPEGCRVEPCRGRQARYCQSGAATIRASPPSDRIARRRSIIRRQPAEHERGFSLTEKKTAEASALSTHAPPSIPSQAVVGECLSKECPAVSEGGGSA